MVLTAARALNGQLVVDDTDKEWELRALHCASHEPFNRDQSSPTAQASQAPGMACVQVGSGANASSFTPLATASLAGIALSALRANERSSGTKAPPSHERVGWGVAGAGERRRPASYQRRVFSFFPQHLVEGLNFRRRW